MDRAENIQYKTPLLNGSNYKVWKKSTRAMLMDRGLYDYVTGTERDPGPDSRDYKQYLRNKDKAMATIYLQVEEEQQMLIGDIEDPIEAWKILGEAYEPSSRARIASCNVPVQ